MQVHDFAGGDRDRELLFKILEILEGRTAPDQLTTATKFLITNDLLVLITKLEQEAYVRGVTDENQPDWRNDEDPTGPFERADYPGTEPGATKK